MSREATRSGLWREVVGFFLATLFLVGAPALLMVEDLRDPACARQVESASSPFRALAVDDHRIARCLEPSPREAQLALAEDGLAQTVRALPDPSW